MLKVEWAVTATNAPIVGGRGVANQWEARVAVGQVLYDELPFPLADDLAARFHTWMTYDAEGSLRRDGRAEFSTAGLEVSLRGQMAQSPS